MNALTRNSAFKLSVSLVLVLAAGLSAAAQSNTYLLTPGTDPCLPKFGFSSFNIHGVGDRVTYVRWGGLASQLGLEPGDMILSLNGYPLNYHGAWNDALAQAVANGGWVQLMVRDVRSGYVAYRQTFVGEGGGGPIVGPITPKFYNGGYNGPVVHHHHQSGNPVGPITPKSNAGGQPNHNLNQTIKKIATLFD
jgi:hypothetical protein